MDSGPRLVLSFGSGSPVGVMVSALGLSACRTPSSYRLFKPPASPGNLYPIEFVFVLHSLPSSSCTLYSLLRHSTLYVLFLLFGLPERHRQTGAFYFDFYSLNQFSLFLSNPFLLVD